MISILLAVLPFIGIFSCGMGGLLLVLGSFEFVTERYMEWPKWFLAIAFWLMLGVCSFGGYAYLYTKYRT
jgi:hypothetical protein